jgi:hypothetical protein
MLSKPQAQLEQEQQMVTHCGIGLFNFMWMVSTEAHQLPMAWLAQMHQHAQILKITN